MDVSLRQIKAFVTVARARSFTKAAAQLHVAQPTLTVQIKRLEESLAVKLFDRTSRAVELTRMGRDLLPAFSQLVQDLDSVLLGMTGSAARYRGIVRIAALPTATADVLPRAIRSFREAHPNADFRIRDVVADRVVQLVESGDVDFGITGGPTNPAEVDTLVEMEDKMVVVFPSTHPMATEKVITPDILMHYPLIMLDPETSVRKIVDAGFLAAGLMPHPAGEVTYMMSALGMVQAGLGITILPVSAREIRSDPTLRFRPIEGTEFVRRISLIKKCGRTLSPLSAAFVAHFSEMTRPAVPKSPKKLKSA